LNIILFLTTIKSSRIDEFRAACDAKFELSTVFKSPAELAVLRKKVIAGDVDTDEVEIVT
jgi:peptide alpha-N-acetyltransferase